MAAESQPGPERSPALEVVILTGLSGAGKSAALRVFEDIGFYCMDNLPPPLLPKFAELTTAARGPAKPEGGRNRVAAVCDVRADNLSDELQTALAALTDLDGVRPLLVFLDADTDVLLRRFSQTRRKHPLGAEAGLEASIERERRILEPLREKADILIDTSGLSFREFQEKLISFFSLDIKPHLLIFVTSFGYKFGLPGNADVVLDVRFLPNPFYDPALSALTGLDSRVCEFLEKQEDTRAFLEKTEDWLGFLIPKYIAEGKSHLGLSVGCTGGRHRSVYVAERFREFLEQRFARKDAVHVSVLHRDLGK